MKQQPEKTEILGIQLEALKSEQIVKKLQDLALSRSSDSVFTPNAEMLYKASIDPEFKNILSSASYLLPDGTGVYLASQLTRVPLQNRSTGIDSARKLLNFAAKNKLSVFLLGGKDGVASVAAKRLCDEIHGLNICGTHHGYFSTNKGSMENEKAIKEIRSASPALLLVCLGSPCQERWIYENLCDLPSVRLAMALGGSLDVWSGNIKRAPTLLRRVGMEWAYRTITNKSRIKRLPSLIFFSAKVLQEGYKNKMGQLLRNKA